MGSGAQFCDLFLRPLEKLLLASSDLRGFYDIFLASLEGAISNALGKEVPLRDFLGTRAYSLFMSEEWHSLEEYVLACFATLPMGDHLAVGVAVTAHIRVLKRIGLCSDLTLIEPGPDA